MYKKQIVFLFLFIPFFAYSKNIAFIIDATASLRDVLPQEKKSIKTIMEILSVFEKNNYITVVKFGNYNEGDIVFSGKISKDKLKEYFRNIDENIDLTKLYTTQTAFSKGLSLILDTNKTFDYTFFITDGEDNYKKSLEKFLKRKNEIKRLGKVIFILVPNNKYGYIRPKYEKKFKQWVKILNANVVKGTGENLIFHIFAFLMKDKIDNKLFGFGQKSFIAGREFTIKKYSDKSKLVYLFFPSIELDSNKIHKGEIYNGEYLSFFSLNEKNKKGIYKIFFKKSGLRKVLYYELVDIEPHIKLLPERKEYFINEAINYSLIFKAQNQTIRNDLFENALLCNLKIGKKVFSGKYKDVKIGTFSFSNLGRIDMCLKYSYFEDILKRKRCEKLSTVDIAKKGNTIKISIEPKGSLYAYQNITLKALFETNKPPKVLRLRLNDKIIKLKNTAPFVYQTNLQLPEGIYVLSPTNDRLVLSGATTFNIKPRNIIVEIFDNTQKVEEQKISVGEKLISTNLKLKYIFDKDTYENKKIRFKVKPILKDESFTFIVKMPKEIKIPVVFKDYIFLIIGREKEDYLKVILLKSNNNININFKRKKKRAIINFLDNDIYIGKIDDFILQNSALNKKFTLGKKDLFIYLEVDPLSRYIFFSKIAGKVLAFIILLIVLGIISVILLAYYLRKRYIKKKLWREVLELSPEDFWDEIPDYVRKYLNLNDLRNYHLMSKKEQEKVINIAYKWKMNDLVSFLNKLKSPIKHKYVEINSNIEIVNFEKGNGKLRLRDKSLGEFLIDISLSFDGDKLIIKFTENIKINGIMYSAGIPIRLDANKLHTIEIGQYRITINKKHGNKTFIINVERF